MKGKINEFLTVHQNAPILVVRLTPCSAAHNHQYFYRSINAKLESQQESYFRFDIQREYGAAQRTPTALQHG